MKFLILSALLASTAYAQMGSGVNQLPDNMTNDPSYSGFRGPSGTGNSNYDEVSEFEDVIEPGINGETGDMVTPEALNPSPNPAPDTNTSDTFRGTTLRFSDQFSGPYDPYAEDKYILEQNKTLEEKQAEEVQAVPDSDQ